MELSFRTYRNEADCLAILEIREACIGVDQTDVASTCEKFPSFEGIKASVGRPDVGDRLLFMVQNGRTIGYAQIDWWKEANDTLLYLHNEWVLPTHRSLHTLRQFTAEIERHIERLAKRARPAATVLLGANASETERYRTSLLEASGYKQVSAQVDMEITDLGRLPQPPWPDGVSVAPLSPADHPKIWEIHKQAYAGDFGALAHDEDSYVDFVDDIRRPEMCFVASIGSEIAAFVLCTEYARMALIDEMVTAPHRQRRGIARALMLHALKALPVHGYETVRLLTAADNHSGARALYEKIGFRTVKQYMRYRKPLFS